ncbi:MAG: ATP-binding cassette domain-containing protein [Acidimicrobiales bacterium]|nr:ATP-binding cassette domain-containing protein [Acidimicrobiales bacterium]
MLEVRRLHKRFGDVVALDGVSFSVDDGQMVGFLGPNGSGKTTTMRAVMGLITLDEGEILWEGRPMTADDRRRFGYMPAERGMYPKMRVREHVVYFARLAGLGPRDAGQAADRWLERLGLADRHDTEVQRLSSGNQQRVQLALALVHDPTLLILDEPFSGLDPLAADTMQQILRERVADGAGALFSSHQLDLVEDVSQDVVIIDEGRVVLSGDVDALRAASPVRYLDVDVEGAREPWADRVPGAEQVDDGGREHGRRVRLRVPRDADPRVALDAAGRAGQVVSFSFSPPGLSEVFRDAVAER